MSRIMLNCAILSTLVVSSTVAYDEQAQSVQAEGTFYSRPNKCYNSPDFKGIKMGKMRGKLGYMMFCSVPNSKGVCYLVSRSRESAIDDMYGLVGGYVKFYAWMTPYFYN
ncbi:hypothetical protein AX774_g5457 [Zancudomyces culisetae]|uniref:Uncharacterized protein n=1 Tax=Zancudomyces culisetae TaxID=1213189 RepID=A0A1R1PJE7_ZANCU|nr:hypothetical protein AX774_g5457 [Zancudomyces culisetae]|eukprot:OMH81091.1 hypothetical protein AX774_g5457 [Zancudomyces culisetae]